MHLKDRVIYREGKEGAVFRKFSKFQQLSMPSN